MSNDNHICPHCGFHTVNEIPQIQNWPEGKPTPPPLPADSIPHPVGKCCSPFKIGDKLYWDLEGTDPDMPPVLVEFREMVTVEGPDYKLVKGKWKRTGEPRPKIAAVKILKETVYECHKPILEDCLDQEVEVTFEALTPEARWPVLELV